MSRVRSRTRTSSYHWQTIQDYIHRQLYHGTMTESHGATSSYTGEYFKESQAMTDDTTGPHHAGFNRYRPWLGAMHECHYTKSKFEGTDAAKSAAGFSKYKEEEGWTSDQYTYTFDSHLHLMYANIAGVDPSTSPNSWSDVVGSHGEFYAQDWVALRDSFYEALESIVPQSFFFGEDATESSGGIFHALKLLVNPSEGVKEGLKFFKHITRGKVHRNYVLGEARQLAKGVANGKLLWQFAIKPLIDDVRNALDAHRVVNERLSFLASHRGTFVPIRVTQKLSSETDSGTAPSRDPVAWHHWLQAKSRYTRGAMSAYAKVRSDITVQPSWAAYSEYFGLNKIIGTAWELIPFTFVLDWFSNAQERVNSMTRIRLSDPFTELTRLMYSTKHVSTWDLMYQAPSTMGAYYNILPSTAICAGTLTDTEYHRTFNCPGENGFWDWPPVSTGKKVSLGALLIQMTL